MRTLTYATAEGVAADVRGELVPGKGLRLLAYGIDRVIGLQVQGAHNIHNAVGAAAAALAQQIDVDAIAEGLAAFKALPGRGARMVSPAGFTLIDDAYNCNPDSAIASIAMLAEKSPHAYSFLATWESSVVMLSFGMLKWAVPRRRWASTISGRQDRSLRTRQKRSALTASEDGGLPIEMN